MLFALNTDESGEYYFREGCYILELHNTPDDPGLSVARVRVPCGVTTRLHRLRGTTERYVIQRGVGEVRLDGGAPLPVTAGDVILIAPGCTQQISNRGSDELVFLAVCTPRFVVSAYEELME